MTPNDEYDRLYGLVAGLCADDHRKSLADAPADLDTSLDLMAAFNLIADLHVPTHAVCVDHLDQDAKHAAATELTDRLLSTTHVLPDRLALLELAAVLASARSRSASTAGDRQ